MGKPPSSGSEGSDITVVFVCDLFISSGKHKMELKHAKRFLTSKEKKTQLRLCQPGLETHLVVGTLTLLPRLLRLKMDRYCTCFSVGDHFFVSLLLFSHFWGVGGGVFYYKI